MSASKPVAAVTRAGIERVSSGSSSATLASRCGLKMTVLRPVAASVTTPERPTSLPVPAVVGMVTMGGTFGPMKLPAVDRVVVVDERPLVRDLERDELARVERRAAADRDDALRAVRPVRGDAVEHVLFDRVRVDLVEDRRRDAGRLEQAADALGDPHLARPRRRTRRGRASAPEALDVVADGRHRAGAEHDRRRERPGHERFAHGGEA